jgi:AmmeMemoRadiSam system protein B
LVINPFSFYYSNKIIELLETKFKDKNTLFLASVDFSHYVEENYAYLHDKKSFYTLNNSNDIKDYKEIEVDCPSCVYILNKLALNNQQFPKLYYRDSSSLIS